MLSVKRSIFLISILVLNLAFVGTVAAGTYGTNLVTNGGFEDPQVARASHLFSGNSVPGWTIEAASGSSATRGGIDLYHHFWTAHEGAQSIDLAALEPGRIRQTLATEPGTTYELTFWLAGNPYYEAPHTQGKKVLKVFWDGAEVSPTTGSFTFDTTGRSYTDMGWTQVTVTGLTANRASTELVFEQAGIYDADGSSGDSRCGVALDDISIMDPRIPAPEFPSTAIPAGWIIGFAGLVFLVRISRDH